MAEKLHFSLVSPEREVYVGEVDQVDAPGSEGDFGVLAGHAPFMTALREGFVTDNGNLILDVRNLQITDPVYLEATINQITGVVTNGLFAARPADLLLLGTADGVRSLRAA